MPCCAVALRLPHSKAGRWEDSLGDGCNFQPRVSVNGAMVLEACRMTFPCAEQLPRLLMFWPWPCACECLCGTPQRKTWTILGCHYALGNRFILAFPSWTLGNTEMPPASCLLRMEGKLSAAQVFPFEPRPSTHLLDNLNKKWETFITDIRPADGGEFRTGLRAVYCHENKV